MKLTESERNTLVNGLTVAATRFDENAVVSAECGHPRLVEQFERQAAESRALAVRFENEDGE